MDVRDMHVSEARAVHELLAEFPQADARGLRALVRIALRERAEARPPRAFRELYQALRVLIEKQ